MRRISANARRVAAALCWLAAACQAQGAATSIHADTAPGRALGTTVSTAGGVTTIDGGTVAGANLFHGFADFSLAAGETARWVYTGGAIAPDKVANVISRVTGGAPSQIAGTLDSSALPNADFYFINPAGIVFGAGAQLNVPQAAYFSTASELRFGPGEATFSATNPQSTLSMANPVAFGFFGTEADLTLDGSALSSPGRLSLSAANLTLTQAGLQGGEVDLFAVGAQALDLPAAAFPSSTLSGRAIITGGAVSASPTPTATGRVVIGAGDLNTRGRIDSSTSGAFDAAGVAIVATSVENLAGGTISSNAEVGSSGAPGSVTFRVSTFRNDGVIATLALGDGATAGDRKGLIQIDSGNDAPLAVSVLNTGTISSNTAGSLNAGTIAITAASVTNSGTISSSAEAGSSGGPRKIFITANSIENDGLITTDTASSGVADPFNSGAGDITLSGPIAGGAADVIINTGVISSSTTGPQQAGSVFLTATLLKVSGEISTNAETGSTGNAGNVSILNTFGEPVAPGAGPSGLQVTGKGSISTNSVSATSAGFIDILESGPSTYAFPAVFVDGPGAQIASANTGSGAAGSINIVTTGLGLSNGGQISTNSAKAAAGNISVLFLSGGFLSFCGAGAPQCASPAAKAADIGQITTTSGAASGGVIQIGMPSLGFNPDTGGVYPSYNPDFIVMNGGEIQALGPGAQANVHIFVGNPDALHGALVQSSDRTNTIAVAGTYALDSSVIDVSAATALLNLNFIDAGSVLHGQCGALAASGAVSQLVDKIKGPYGAPLTERALAAANDTAAGCASGSGE